MATTAQTLANQSNAQSSTGPTSDAGKLASSQNAFRHGLASSQIIIPGESEAEFDALLQAFTAEYTPATLSETLLVHDLAKHRWLADRAVRLQGEQFILAPPGVIPATLSVLIRYQTTNERAYRKAHALLTTQINSRLDLENGFVSQSLLKSAAAFNKKAHKAMLDHIEFAPIGSPAPQQIFLTPKKSEIPRAERRS